MSLLFSLLISIASQAQIFEGPVSSAMGGSGRAGLDANEGVFLNPALVALISKSEIAGYFRDGYADEQSHRQALGGSLSENDEDVLVPGELSYFRTRDTGVTPQATDGELWQGSFGKLFFNRLAVGVSGYKVTFKPIGQPSTDQWNGALGVVYQIIPNLGVAYVFENPVNASGNVPLELRLVPQQSFGLFYKTQYNAQFRLDVLRWEQENPGQRWNVHSSVETQLNQYWVFRLGGRLDEIQDERYLTAGIAFTGPALKVDYSIEKNMLRTGGAVHSVDIRTSF